MRVVDAALFAPRTPRATLAADGALALDPNGERAAAIAWDVFRDGREIAHHLPGTTTAFRDPDVPPHACYAVESVFLASGNASYHSRAVCGAPPLDVDLAGFTVAHAGEYALELLASNPGDVTTGITCAVRHVRVESDGASVADGYVFVPHGGDGSSYLRVRLDASRRYRIVVDADDRATNMSVFAHFSRYGGRGGREGASNTLVLRGARLHPR